MTDDIAVQKRQIKREVESVSEGEDEDEPWWDDDGKKFVVITSMSVAALAAVYFSQFFGGLLARGIAGVALFFLVTYFGQVAWVLFFRLIGKDVLDGDGEDDDIDVLKDAYSRGLLTDEEFDRKLDNVLRRNQ